MSIFDRFLDAIKLNDDYDDEEDFLDDEELEDEDYEDEKPRESFFSRFTAGKSRPSRSFDEDEEDEEDDFDFEVEEKPQRTARSSARESEPVRNVRSSSRTSYSTDRVRSGGYGERSESSRRETSRSKPEKKAKSAPVRKKGGMPMEVNVIRPTSMEDTKDIADTLMDTCTVVLNLEGIDVDLAQRIIDFTCGTCYALGGGLQKISSYIYILTPADVDISGDVTSILSGAFDIPSMRSPY